MQPGGFQPDMIRQPGMMQQQQQGMMQQQQQMLGQVRSPPPGMPVRSPNPAASPRMGGMVPSPHAVPSPHHPHMGVGGGEDMNGGHMPPTSSHMMLGQPNSGGGGGGGLGPNMSSLQGSMMEGQQEPPTMTPQDQLSKFVETL
jgi:hypothetical protein